jgi:hypothetical protein
MGLLNSYSCHSCCAILSVSQPKVIPGVHKSYCCRQNQCKMIWCQPLGFPLWMSFQLLFANLSILSIASLSFLQLAITTSRLSDTDCKFSKSDLSVSTSTGYERTSWRKSSKTCNERLRLQSNYETKLHYIANSCKYFRLFDALSHKDIFCTV